MKPLKPNPIMCECGRNRVVMSPEAQAFYDRAVAEKHPNLNGVLFQIKMYEAEKRKTLEDNQSRLEALKIRFLPKPAEPVDDERVAVQNKLMPFIRSLRMTSHLRARAVKHEGRWCIEIKAPHKDLQTAPDSYEGLEVIKVCDCGLV